MKLVWPARYYDGQTPVARDVTVVLSPDGIKAITDEGVAGQWEWFELEQPPRLQATDPVRFEPSGAGGEAILVEDPALLDAIAGIAPERSRRLAPSWRRRRWRAVALIAGIVAGAGTLYLWVIPFLADRTAARVPLAWEEELGEQVMGTLTEGVRRCESTALASALDTIVAQLAAAQPSRYRFRVRVVDRSDVNAFAAPGGYMVVFTGLIKASQSAEELAGVLAHEMQHVYQQHGTRTLLRQIPLRLLASSLSGDIGPAAGIAGTLGALRYQREHEEDADRRGLDLMIAAGMDPRGMPSFFRTLQRQSADMPGTLRYLSSHPRTADRISRLDALAGAAPAATPLLPGTDWLALRERCASQLPVPLALNPALRAGRLAS